MAYRNLQIKFRRVSSLRGDGDGDGGYANRDFYIETHLEGEVISEDELKKMMVKTVEPAIRNIMKNSLTRKTRPKK